MRRITTARFGRIYPEVFAMIDRGDLSLTVASLAAKSFESLKQKHNNIASTIEKLATFFNQRKDPLQKSTAKYPAKNDIHPILDHTKIEQDKKDCPQKKRYIPAKTRQSVYRAANGRCSYVNPQSGRRYTERKHLQVDHIKPFARGGDHSLSNLQLLCRGHNLMRAWDDFGDKYIQSRLESAAAAAVRVDRPQSQGQDFHGQLY